MGTVGQVIEWSDEAFGDALKRAAEGIVQAPGVRLSARQLERLLDAAPRHPEHPQQAQLKSGDLRDATFTADASFDGATFTGDASFDGATFTADASFSGATFGGDASFDGVTFGGDASFDGATFSGDSRFFGATFTTASFYGATFRFALFGGQPSARRPGSAGATFSGNANFAEANFSGPISFFAATFTTASFDEATFSGHADFAVATFSADARFGGATFNGFSNFGGTIFRGNASFVLATFSGYARFDQATFRDASFDQATFRDASFDRVTFRQSAAFDGATFEAVAELGPVHVYDRISLDRVVFAQRVRIEVSALRASFARAEFRRGADVRLRWAEVWLEDTDFAEPSLLTALPARRLTSERSNADAFLGWEKPAPDGTWCWVPDEPPRGFGPRVLSLGGSRVASLTLSGVHLEACRFAGAHGLDHLVLERAEFPWPPDGWRWVRWGPLRWTLRQTIAEEHQWRARRSHGRGWDQGQSPVGSRHPWPPEPPAELEPDRIAGLYRQLRKSREDSKDEPGANDFYYGEMEMRRRSGPIAERSILWLYWLVSGYGLRSSRALLALAIAIAVLGALPLALWGFRPTLPYGRSLLFALQSSISLLRPPTSRPGYETAGGQVIEIFLRLAGPLFFGLALLALRGRVKR